jgi:hypothetical protein
MPWRGTKNTFQVEPDPKKAWRQAFTKVGVWLQVCQGKHLWYTKGQSLHSTIEDNLAVTALLACQRARISELQAENAELKTQLARAGKC